MMKTNKQLIWDDNFMYFYLFQIPGVYHGSSDMSNGQAADLGCCNVIFFLSAYFMNWVQVV